MSSRWHYCNALLGGCPASIRFSWFKMPQLECLLKLRNMTTSAHFFIFIFKWSTVLSIDEHNPFWTLTNSAIDLFRSYIRALWRCTVPAPALSAHSRLIITNHAHLFPHQKHYKSTPRSRSLFGLESVHRMLLVILTWMSLDPLIHHLLLTWILTHLRLGRCSSLFPSRPALLVTSKSWFLQRLPNQSPFTITYSVWLNIHTPNLSINLF